MDTNNMHAFFYDYFINWGISQSIAIYLNAIALGIILIIIVVLLDIIVRKILRLFATTLSLKSKTKFDDLLIKNRAPRRVAHIAPLYMLLVLSPIVLKDFPQANYIVSVLLKLVGLFLILRIIRSFLHTLRDYFKTIDGLRDKPIDSYIQVFMIFAWIFMLFFATSLITSISIVEAITTFGAASAIILLIFKDTILGFVASIQVSINDIVRIGDWVTFDKYGADGDVIEINLSTVKVQNFDKTITTIPTYGLISDSFKNWRGMKDSEGRRIKRSLLIKQESIKFLSDSDVQRFKKIGLISNYLDHITKKVISQNQKNSIDTSILINGATVTNIGLFRKYMETYIENHSAIHKEMTLMCRQLAPTSQGIPLEVYCFSKDKEWANYEYIMADLFDHFLAAVSFFDLELFELPSSNSANKFVDINL